MSGYCQVSDALNLFPRFQADLPNNITSAAIQNWIDQGKAMIRARFLRRGLDPDNPATLGWNPPLTALTPDQANVLAKFNIAYVVGRFGDAAYSILSEGELKLVSRAWDEWNSMSSETDGVGPVAMRNTSSRSSRFILGNDGLYDAIFSPNATHVQIGPMFGGHAGADFDPRQINDRTQGTHHAFEKAMKF